IPLKPDDRERFEKALRRVKAWIRGERTGNLDRKLIALLEGLKPEPKYLERLVVKSGGRIIFLRSEEIDWIEAAGNYIRLHSGSEAPLLRERRGGLQRR